LKRSNRLILLIGVFLAIVAFIGIVLLLSQPQPDGNGGGTGEVVDVNVVIATVDIPVGTIVTADMVRDELVSPTVASALREQAANLVIGKTARRNILFGQQILTTDFTGQRAPDEISVPPGKRAIALEVNQVTGVGTLIKPGDYVDVVVGLNFQVVTVNPDDQSITVVEAVDGQSVKLILQNLQVIATLLPPAPAPAQGAPAASPGTALTGQQELVIVAATAEQIEVLKFIQLEANISLVLRSTADYQERDPVTNEVILPVDEITTGIVLRSLIDNYGVLTPQIVEAILPTPAP
jgi:pilus assembly protein CpaB